MIPRSALVFVHDLAATAVAWVAAYWLRFNFDIPSQFVGAMLASLVLVVPVEGAVLFAFSLYRGLWRFASVSDLIRISLACLAIAVLMPTMLLMLGRVGDVPRSVFVISPMILLLLMGGMRFAYRAWKDGRLSLWRPDRGTPVLIVGGGNTAATLVRDLERSPTWRVVGIIEEAAGQAGKELAGVPILGGLDAMMLCVERSGVKHAIIAMPAASAGQRRRAAEAAASVGLSVLTVPTMDDLLAGRVSVSNVRKVELEDLLGRERIDLDEAGLHGLLCGKVVLVTGAGGSIGSELCRQIMRFSPRRLVLYEWSEYALYNVGQEFEGKPVTCLVGDVKDEARLAAVFRQHRPEIVFHAAAYKHVPMMENGNSWEAVRNNVLGTLRVARAAGDSGVGEFVLVSTDKAVNPTNVMGASKRLAEMVCQALQRQHATTFVMVRFGNVLGSSGSVLPKFREQIAKGGPVTVTHPDIIRYFMLIPEAAQLVLQAGLMASRAKEGGEIFVLDMGEPVKIVDLAKDMIRLSNLTTDDIQIEFTGLRPGEKLYEELLADGERTLPTPHPKLRIARPTVVPNGAWLEELEAWLFQPTRDDKEVKETLAHWVPEYCPTPNLRMPADGGESCAANSS